MSTAAQFTANRTNAQLSTGPASPEGKSKSKLNALRHGLTGQAVLIPGEDEQIYLAFTQQYFEALHPEGTLERQLAQSAADAQWRINRIKSIEDAMFAQPLHNFEGDAVESALAVAKTFQDNSRAFATLSIYEQRLNRTQEKALRQLRDLQAERAAALEEAVLLKQFDEMEGRHFDPAENGFVFSITEITLHQRRKERLSAARTAEIQAFNRKTFRHAA